MKLSLLLDTDSYKASHHTQYPADVTWMQAYLESRGGEFDSTVFFGLQYLLKNYFATTPTKEEVLYAADLYAAHGLPFNLTGWLRIANLGYYPLHIRAVPEGTLVPKSNVLMTVENTERSFTWLVGWVETVLSRVWAPIAVATYSYECRKLIYAALKESADAPDAEIGFKLHDFGARGVSSQESAAILGMAHLTSFLGSDTVAALVGARDYYSCAMAGFSIPATEHSTVITWGRDNEAVAYGNFLNSYHGKMFACVSDSYDLDYAVSEIWGGSLQEQVKAHGAKGGVLVIRPDSGDPVKTTMGVLNGLNQKFFATCNSKGFKVLPPYLRVIYGDGIDYHMIDKILQAMHANGYSASNIAFGCGGSLLQKHTRDTHKMAYKVCAVADHNGVRGVYKEPKGDPVKRSKGGVLDLLVNNGVFSTVSTTVRADFPESALRTVFDNGKLLNETTYTEVRERVPKCS